MPCATTWMEEWFCPARISIARKCPRTGRKFQYPEGHTITLDWFAYRKNFNYLYCGAMGRVFVIKRADSCTPITGRIELPCWQVTNVTSMWGTVKSPVSSLEVGEMNSIVLDIHYDYVVSAFLDVDPVIQVPNPIIRHILGLYPLASFSTKGKMRQIVRMQGGSDVEPYVCHVFSMKKGQNSNEYTTAAVTYLQHYHFRMSSTDPMEGTEAVALKTSEERIGVSLVESNEEHGWWNLAYELMLIQGFENRKYVVNGLSSYAYTALHNWCCLHMITNSTSGVFCVLCSRQINTESPEDVKKYMYLYKYTRRMLFNFIILLLLAR